MKGAARHHPALALVELASIARGYRVVDALAKKAPSELLAAHPISGGHFIALFAGDVAVVEESLGAALEVAGEHLLDRVWLPGVHEQVVDAASNALRPKREEIDAIAIVETFTVGATLRAADAACKCAPVRLIAMRLGQGIGGKAFFALTGDLYDVEASVEAAVEGATARLVQQTEIIARPDESLVELYVG